MTRAPTWAEYRALCDTPEVWSRWMLLRTAALLEAFDEPQLAATLAAACAAPPLTKPVDHCGSPTTDMFRLGLRRAELERVVGAMQRAAAAGWRVSGAADAPAAWPADATLQGRDLGGFVEAWSEYLRAAPSEEPAGEPAGEP